MRCLRKEPSHRYPSAGALRDDLRRFLDGRPIFGRPVSAVERARNWARQRPAVAALMGVVVLLACGLVGGGVLWASWLGWHNRQLELQVARADRGASEAQRQTRIAEERRHQADRHHHAEGLRRARRALDARQIELAQDLLRDLKPEPGGDDLRGFAWRYLWRQAHREFSQLWGHELTVVGMALAPDGGMLVTRDLQGKALLWDLSPDMALDEPRTLPDATEIGSDHLAFSPNGQYLAALSRVTSNIRIELFEVAANRHFGRIDFDHGGSFHFMSVGDDGRRVAGIFNRAGGGQTVVVRERESAGASPGLQRRTIGRDTPSFHAFSADGSLLGVSDGATISLLDPWTGEARVVLEGPHSGPIGPSAFSADGRFFGARVEAIHRIVLWETRSGREVGQFDAAEGLSWLEFSPKGSRLALMDVTGRVTILDRASGQQRALAPRQADRKNLDQHLAFSPDETLLAIGFRTAPGGIQPVEVWDTASARRLAVFPGRKDVIDVTFLRSGRSLVLAGGTTPRIWRLDPPSEPEALAGHTAEAWSAAFSPDGSVLATGSDDTRERQTIRLWDPASGRLVAGWKAHTATVSALAFSPDGKMLASGSLDSGKAGNPDVILWDATTHRQLTSLEGHGAQVRSVAFSPDGGSLATASDDLTARIWDLASKTTRAILTGHRRGLTRVAFSPDGRTLATASNDATVRLWDVDSGRPISTLQDVGNTLAVAFSPDGSMLASVNENGIIKVWDRSRGELVRTIPGEADQLRCLAFTPDGRNVAVAGKGKVIRFWDVATGQELLTLEGHKAQINALAFSPDGSTLVSCGHDGAVKLWRAGPIRLAP